MSYMTPEGRVKRKGRDIVKRLGIYYFAVNQTGIGRGGTPDDVLCVNGKFVHIEYKARMDWRPLKSCLTTLPTEQQIKRMDACRDNGGITLVVDAMNVDSLEQTLTKIAKHKKSSDYKIEALPCFWGLTHARFTEWKKEQGLCRK